MNKKVLLTIGIVLLCLGWFKPNLNLGGINNKPINAVVVSVPTNKDLKESCKNVIDSLKSGNSDRTKDGNRLADLYMDLATLIELDGEDEVIRTTEEVRQANSLTGLMLRMNIKDKYKELSKSLNDVIVVGIGEDIIPLDADLRAKAAESFRALAWACSEGAK
jgi:hypothetical protein